MQVKQDDEIVFVQPLKCKGCIWGGWTGTRQFCSKQRCVKTG